MNQREYSALTITDLFMVAIDGEIQEEDGFIQTRRRENPYYYWGNYLLLPSAPQADELEGWIEKGRTLFADDPKIKHVLLRWDGAPLTFSAKQRARELGMSSDHGVEMIAHSLKGSPSSEIEVRRLDFETEGQKIIDLNIACDGTEPEGTVDYRLFKRALRASWRLWHDAGVASWWGAFIAGELVGQCGMVHCSDGWGRFQSVETHPAFRRRGVCSTLIKTVGDHALGEGRCSGVILGADSEGPAVSLYRRLGFELGKEQHGLLLSQQTLQICPERFGDRAEIKALVTAAFKGPSESKLIDLLADEPEVISLVAQKDGALLGHLLFSPVIIKDSAGSKSVGSSSAGSERREIALAPVAVRPTQQGNGVGTALIEEGLRRCREAGWSLAFVLGDPRFYQRFGWQLAAKHRLSCRWDQSGEHFQVLELKPDALAGCHGQVNYHRAFDEID